MKDYLIAERYAKALCSSLEDGELDVIGGMLGEAAQLYTESDDLRNVLNSPAIDLEKRRDILRDVLAAAGTDERAQRLLDTLLTRGRIAMLSAVATVFGMLADVRMNRVRADIVTAAEPTEEQEARLVDALKRWTGKDVRIQRRLDPDILGGVVAKLGDTVIDGSVRTRIERLREYALEYDIRAHVTQ